MDFSAGRRIYWGIVFAAYKIVAGRWIALRLSIGLLFLLMGFFPKTIWLLLGVVIVAILLAVYYFLGRDELVAVTFFLFAMSITLAWIIGRGIVLMENL